MKKIIAVFLFMLFLAAVMSSVSVSASQSTSYTYTLSVNGNWVRTQDAYMPGELWFRDDTLNAAEDIFLHRETLYVADTGNSRIISFNIETQSIDYINNENFVSPCGLFVNDEAIFVADSGAQKVFKLDFNGNILMEIKRPDSYLFSEQSQYMPRNVAVTKQGIIFVCGLGSYEGLMQFDENGVFQGYFAANTTKITFLERIEEMLFTEEQMASLLTRTPNPIYNIDISDRDMIYSVTQLGSKELAGSKGKGENAIKYHNMAGEDILSKDKIDDEHNFTDVASFRNGISFAVTNSGIIYVYDESGNVVFSFGGRTSDDRNGLFTFAAAIDTDDRGRMYILDKEGGYIQVFYPTEFAQRTYNALYNIQNGSYAESESEWLQLLSLNGMSLTAHKGYAKVLYQQERFAEAAEQFRIIGDKQNYSECMWEIRNIWFQKNLIYIIAILIFIFMFICILKLLKTKGKIHLSHNCKSRFGRKFDVQMSYLFGMMRHPIDELYYLKHGRHGSVLSATVIYVLTFTVYLLDSLCRSFTFQLTDAAQVSKVTVVVIFLAPVILWVVGNTMVSSINEGEGTLKNIYTVTAYAFTPYLLIAPFVIAFSYLLTLNESVIIEVAWWTAIIWSFVLICMSVKEVHNYNLKETVKIILLTLFFMIMAVIVIFIIYVIELQVVSFVKDIFNEVIYNAHSY